MSENDQVTGNQEPQNVAPQDPNQQPAYVQQPQYAAPQVPGNPQPTYVQQPQYTAPQVPNQQQPPYVQQPQYTAPQAPNQQPPYTQQPNPQYVNPQQPYNPQQPNAPYYAGAVSDNSKVYCILSYLSILWLIGLLGDQKNNPRVRFHVNQGIILTIFAAALNIVSWIVNGIIGAIFRVDYYGYLTYVSSAGQNLQHLVSFLVSAAILVLMIIGIVNVSQNKDQPLPIIGKLFRIVK